MNKELLKDLDGILAQYDKVFLVSMAGAGGQARWQRFLASDALKNCGKQLLFFVPHGALDSKDAHQAYREITMEEFRQLRDLYCMYEFSDRFSLFSDEERWGSIWNFVRTGILTEEEAFAAILR